MADNRVQYGFRWVRSLYGGASSHPATVPGIVASDQSFDVNGGASNVRLRPGDPVIRLSTGGFNLCDGAEGAGGALKPFGVVYSVEPYWDGEIMRPSFDLPSHVVYSTNLERQSKINVIPFVGNLFEIDTDDTSSSYDTLGEFQDMAGENADYRLNGASGSTWAHPRLDISTNATTNTLVLRIVGVSPTQENVDFTGNYVKMLVEINLPQHPFDSATGT